MSITRIQKQFDRQRKFSAETFGPRVPDGNVMGIVDHILKELIEIEEEPTDLEEWIDLIMLTTDGMWRFSSMQHYNPESQLSLLETDTKTVFRTDFNTVEEHVNSVRDYVHLISTAPKNQFYWAQAVWLAISGAYTFAVREDQNPFMAIMDMLEYKQEKNEGRKWPDWRTATPGKAIEHIEDGEADDDSLFAVFTIKPRYVDGGHE